MDGIMDGIPPTSPSARPRDGQHIPLRTTPSASSSGGTKRSMHGGHFEPAPSRTGFQPANGNALQPHPHPGAGFTRSSSSSASTFQPQVRFISSSILQPSRSPQAKAGRSAPGGTTSTFSSASKSLLPQVGLGLGTSFTSLRNGGGGGENNIFAGGGGGGPLQAPGVPVSAHLGVTPSHYRASPGLDSSGKFAVRPLLVPSGGGSPSAGAGDAVNSRVIIPSATSSSSGGAAKPNHGGGEIAGYDSPTGFYAEASEPSPDEFDNVDDGPHARDSRGGFVDESGGSALPSAYASQHVYYEEGHEHDDIPGGGAPGPPRRDRRTSSPHEEELDGLEQGIQKLHAVLASRTARPPSTSPGSSPPPAPILLGPPIASPPNLQTRTTGPNSPGQGLQHHLHRVAAGPGGMFPGGPAVLGGGAPHPTSSFSQNLGAPVVQPRRDRDYSGGSSSSSETKTRGGVNIPGGTSGSSSSSSSRATSPPRGSPPPPHRSCTDAVPMSLMVIRQSSALGAGSKNSSKGNNRTASASPGSDGGTSMALPLQPDPPKPSYRGHDPTFDTGRAAVPLPHQRIRYQTQLCHSPQHEHYDDDQDEGGATGNGGYNWQPVTVVPSERFGAGLMSEEPEISPGTGGVEGAGVAPTSGPAVVQYQYQAQPILNYNEDETTSNEVATAPQFFRRSKESVFSDVSFVSAGGNTTIQGSPGWPEELGPGAAGSSTVVNVLPPRPGSVPWENVEGATGRGGGEQDDEEAICAELRSRIDKTDAEIEEAKKELQRGEESLELLTSFETEYKAEADRIVAHTKQQMQKMNDELRKAKRKTERKKEKRFGTGPALLQHSLDDLMLGVGDGSSEDLEAERRRSQLLERTGPLMTLAEGEEEEDDGSPIRDPRAGGGMSLDRDSPVVDTNEEVLECGKKDLLADPCPTGGTTGGGSSLCPSTSASSSSSSFHSASGPAASSSLTAAAVGPSESTSSLCAASHLDSLVSRGADLGTPSGFLSSETSGRVISSPVEPGDYLVSVVGLGVGQQEKEQKERAHQEVQESSQEQYDFWKLQQMKARDCLSSSSSSSASAGDTSHKISTIIAAGLASPEDAPGNKISLASPPDGVVRSDGIGGTAGLLSELLGNMSAVQLAVGDPVAGVSPGPGQKGSSANEEEPPLSLNISPPSAKPVAPLGSRIFCRPEAEGRYAALGEQSDDQCQQYGTGATPIASSDGPYTPLGTDKEGDEGF